MNGELFCVFKFRPSSHSDDYSVIATYMSKKDAVKAHKTVERLLKDMEKNSNKHVVDWSPDEAELLTWNDTVSFRVYTTGYLETVEKALEQEAKPKTIKYHTNYQEISITLKVPKCLTPKTAMIVLDQDDAKAFRWLLENVGSPEITKASDDGEQMFTWDYAGNEIYRDGYLFVDFEFYVDQKDNWTVSE